MESVTPRRTARPAPPPTTICATCAHGQSDGYGMVECQLGWEAHDNVWGNVREGRKWTWIPMAMGHPGVPKPLLAPQTACMVPGGAWKLQP